MESYTNRLSYLIIHEITLNNFTSYYGKHVIKLEPGVNYIVGSCGSGRTNIARAFQFAVLGYCDYPKITLVNHFHKEDMREENKTAFCEVEAKILHENRIYICKSSLQLNTKGRIKQTTTINSEIDKTIESQNFGLIYLNPLKMRCRKKDVNELGSVKIWNALWGYLAENRRLNLGLVILDQVMYHFDYATTERMQNCLSKLPFDQIILIDNGTRASQDKNPHNTVMVIDNKGSSTIRYPINSNEDEQIENKSPVFPNPADSEVNFENTPKLLECETKNIEKSIIEFYGKIQKTQSIINQYTTQKDFTRAKIYSCNLSEKKSILKTTIKAQILINRITHLLSLYLIKPRFFINLPISIELLRMARGLIQCLMPEVEQKLERVVKIIEKRVNELMEYYSIIDRQDISNRVEKILTEVAKETDEQYSMKFPI
jgi:hypothetical protein